MHSIRREDDQRGNSLAPNTETLMLQEEIRFDKDVFPAKSGRDDWTLVVTNPAPFCKKRLA